MSISSWRRVGLPLGSMVLCLIWGDLASQTIFFRSLVSPRERQAGDPLPLLHSKCTVHRSFGVLLVKAVD